MAPTNRQILLNEIPKGKLAPEHFRQAEAPLPKLIGLLAGEHIGKRMVKVA